VSIVERADPGGRPFVLASERGRLTRRVSHGDALA
jgi:hypothetical protein